MKPYVLTGLLLTSSSVLANANSQEPTEFVFCDSSDLVADQLVFRAIENLSSIDPGKLILVDPQDLNPESPKDRVLLVFIREGVAQHKSKCLFPGVSDTEIVERRLDALRASVDQWRADVSQNPREYPPDPAFAAWGFAEVGNDLVILMIWSGPDETAVGFFEVEVRFGNLLIPLIEEFVE